MSERATLELALRDEPQAVMLTNQQLVVISNTDFVAKGMRGNVSACLACVARARAIGIPDIVALGGGITIINGKAVLASELMSAIARKHGHSITFKETDDEVIAYGKRVDNGDEGEARFTMKMAATAGLLGKDNWKKHPDDMMFARAMSKLCRRLFSDCYAGGTYTPQDFDLTDQQVKDGDYSSDLELTADEVSDEPPSERVALEVPEYEIAAGLGDPEITDGLAKPESGRVAPPESVSPEGLSAEREGVGHSGSVSPWTQLVASADTDRTGLLVALAKERFPGRKPSDLTEIECEGLWQDTAPVTA